jgi:hypothetical protein
MTDDPAVRSVRVAVALCDRLGDLLQGPDKVKAVKQNRALFGVSGNDEALSMRIGEVQQIYPEIWRHLDDARNAFAARGIDVAKFDEIRAAEGLALGASPDIKRQDYGAGQYGYAETVKSANFNRAGHARAKQASRELMLATPQIDWQAIAKAEAEDPNVAAFTRSTNTKRYIMFGVLGLVIASPFVYVWNAKREERARYRSYTAAESPAQSEGDRTKIAKLVADARGRLAPASAAWDAAFKPELLATLKASDKPCAYKFPAPTPASADKFVKYASLVEGYGPEFGSHDANDPIPNQLAPWLARIENLERMAAQTAVRTVESNLKDIPAYAVVVVIDKEVAPKPGSGTAFTPGQVAARGYVYSVADRKIACTAALDVANTPTLETPADDKQAEDALFRELDVKLRQALAANLRGI